MKPFYVSALLLLGACQTVPPGAVSSPAADRDAVVELSRQWIEEGWSPGTDTQGFAFERDLERFYTPVSGDGVFHDTNDPELRIAHDARRYVGDFAPFVAQQASLTNDRFELEHIHLDGSTAVVAFTADAVFETPEGEVARVPHFYSLGWRKEGTGGGAQWRIFHEHGSSLAPEGEP